MYVSSSRRKVCLTKARTGGGQFSTFQYSTCSRSTPGTKKNESGEIQFALFLVFVPKIEHVEPLSPEQNVTELRFAKVDPETPQEC